MTIIFASSGYYNLRLNEKTSYLTTFVCQFGKYSFTRMYQLEWSWQMICFQQNIDEIFKDMPNVFGTAEDILFIWFDADGKDHGITLRQVIQI